jgi:YVTN family beta-propeller protein
MSPTLPPPGLGPQRPDAYSSPNVSSINVGSDPTSATYDATNGYMYVPNGNSDNVSVINGTTVVATVAVGSGPWPATYDAADGDVYVPNGLSANVSVINGTKVVASVGAGTSPTYSVYDGGNGYVYVSDLTSNTVSVIHGTSLVGSVNVGNTPAVPAYDSRNGYIYVPDDGGSTVSVIHGTKLIATVSTGTSPYSATYDGRNGYVYVTNYGSDNVSVISDMTVVGSVNAGTGPTFGTYDDVNGYVYVSNFGSSNVTVINGTTVVVSVDVGSEPEGASCDVGNGYVYVTNQASKNVSAIRGTKLAGTVPVGASPNSAGYDPANGYVYVTDSGASNVSVLIIGYELTFAETGLPLGAGWWVNVTGGQSTSSTTSTLSFNESWSTYSYTVSTTAKNYSSPGGSFEAPGIPASVPIAFSLIPYPVTFTETGLPAETNWSLTIGSVTRTSTTTTIALQEPNGTHAYTVGPVPGWRAESYAGSITVRGGVAPTTIPWLRVTYQITFAESGLPASTEWWVNVTSGLSTPSEGTTLSFREPNGSYAYSVATRDKAYSAVGGSFAVNGLNVSESVPFSAVNYTVTFTESGLPSGTGWWVNVTAGSSALSTTFSMTEFLSFDESNGTYPYSVSAANANYSSSRGSLLIEGSGVSKTVVFSLVAFPVTFTESGLPAETTWSVTFHGATESGNENLEFTTVPNGTYGFTVGFVAGYTANRTSGTVTVHGGPAAEPVAFSPTKVPTRNNTSPATFLGLPATEGYGVLGGVIIAILVLTMLVVLLRRRRGRTPPEPARSTSTDAGDPPASR